MKVSAIDRFMDKVFKHPNGCWIWTGARDAYDYGKFRCFDKCHLAHRWIREYIHNDIGDKLCLHICDTPSCVNPDHLYPGDFVQNAIDSVDRLRHHNVKKTHCKYGHEYTKDNTVNYGKMRHCITCRNIKLSGTKRKFPTLSIGTREQCQTTLH